MNEPNTYTTIDRRPKLPCGCGCGKEATLQYFLKVDGRLILPSCVDAHEERKSAQRLLREIILRQSGFWRRMSRCRRVYRLQFGIFERQGAAQARRTAFRSAVIYLLGTRAGLWASLLWRKQQLFQNHQLKTQHEHSI